MKKLLPLVAILFLLISTPAFANNGKNHDGGKKDDSHVEIKVKTNSNNRGGDDEEEKSGKFNLDLDVGEDKFEVKGEITSLGTNSFVIGGQTINVDPSKVDKFKQKGILVVGNIAKVEGVIVDNAKYAEEIKLIGTGQGRFKFEVRGLVLGTTSSPNPSPSPEGTTSATPSVSPSPDVSPSPTPQADSNVRVKIKANGPIDQVIAFLSQILGYLTGSSTPTPSPSPSPSASPTVSPSPEMSPTPAVSPSPTPEVSPSPVASPSPEVSPSPDVSPSPTPTVLGAGDDDDGKGAIEKLIESLQKLIEALQNLL